MRPHLLDPPAQAYQKRREVGELKGDAKPPGPLETFAEVIEEDGVLVGGSGACPTP